MLGHSESVGVLCEDEAQRAKIESGGRSFQRWSTY